MFGKAYFHVLNARKDEESLLMFTFDFKVFGIFNSYVLLFILMKVCRLLSTLSGKREAENVFGKRNVIHLCTQCCEKDYCNNAICTDTTSKAISTVSLLST